MKFVLCPMEVTVSSDMVERISKFVHCAMDHDYEPYSKPSGTVKSLLLMVPWFASCCCYVICNVCNNVSNSISILCPDDYENIVFLLLFLVRKRDV